MKLLFRGNLSRKPVPRFSQGHRLLLDSPVPDIRLRYPEQHSLTAARYGY